jgi:uncharacterized repeat protein (TIGR01451 family)
MRMSPRFIVKYAIGFFVSLIAVSNCLNVLSSSSDSRSLPGEEASIVETLRPGRHVPNLTFLGRAMEAQGLIEGSSEAEVSMLTALTRASAFSPFAPNITATKSHTPVGSAHPGDTLTYTVVITNSGTSDATGVNFSDTIDPNTTLVGGSVIASPIAVNDSYNTIGNVNISVPVAQGVIANDLNPNGAGTLTVTKVNSTIVPGGGSATDATANGSVTMSSDGSFTYTPNVAFRGPSDSFTYTLDNGTGKIDTATVSIAVNGLIWFVNTAATPGGDGRLATPFNCLVGAGCFDPVASDIANDNIFVYSGSYTGGLTLLSGQKLIGQGAGDTLLSITGLSAPSGTNLLPSTGGTSPTITAAATNITLGSGNTIRGVTLNGAAAAAVDLAGNSFGTATIAETALGGQGQALNLNNGTLTGPVASTAAFTSISSISSSTTGVSLASVAGNLSSGSTSVITPAGIGVSVNTSSGAFNFAGTSVSQSGAAGVSLTTNSGTISFAALDITNTTTNQGGLIATDNSNTITTTSGAINTGSGTAVNITRASGTTPLNVSLTSVSTSGAANGILLSGTSGSFTVNGDGIDTTLGGNNSGGTISSAVGGDGAIAGNGIYVSNASNVTLRRMHMNNHANFAVYGTNATAVTLEYTTIDGVNGSNGTTPFNEGSIAFDGLFGTSTFTGDIIKGGLQDNFRIRNSSGTGDITITGCTIRDTSTGVTGNDNLNIEANTSATVTAHVTGNTFAATNGDHFQCNTINSATMTIVFTGNFYSGGGGGSALGQGITISGGNAGSSEHVNFNISNNGSAGSPLVGNIQGGAINVNQGGGGGVWQGQVSGNFIGNSAVAGSGSTQSSGIRVENHSATGTLTAIVDSNQIKSWNNGAGVNFQVGDVGNVNAAITLTVTNNTIANPGATSQHGVQGNFGANAAGTNAVCFDFRGNNINLGGVPPNGGADLRLRQRNGSTVRLPGYLGANTDLTAVANFEKAQNALSDVGAEVSAAVAVPPGGGFVGGASCASPVVPLSARPAFDIASKNPGDTPAVDIDDIASVLRTARDQASGEPSGQELTEEGLRWIVKAALQRWKEAAISAEDMARLEEVTFTLVNLRDGELAVAMGSQIRIDKNAAGYGWFFDQTPQDDAEFDVPVPDKEAQSTEFSPAFGRMDLLTVVMRELGTVYLQGNQRVPKQLRSLMQPTLSPAVRRMPEFRIPDRSTSLAAPSVVRSNNAAAIPPSQPKTLSVTPTRAVFNPRAEFMTDTYLRSAKRMSYTASARRVALLSPFSGETVTLNIGTIPTGESVTIMFQVTVNNPLPAGVCSVTNVGHVTGSNFSQVDTNSDVANIETPVTIGACPAPIVRSTDPNLCTAVVTYSTPTASGCPTPTVTCNPPSGSAFPKGSTMVTCTASNGVSPDASCNFTVTVNDTQPPTIGSCPSNITVDENPAGSGSATVTYATPSSSDNCPGQTVNCSPASGSSFAVGTTTVTCTAMDTSGNTASCQFTVTVNSVGLSNLGPAKVWIGLKNSDDVGTKFDLLAEVLKNGSVVGSGQLNDVPGGSSGFNNAALRIITLALGSSVGIGPGDTLSFRLSVRIAATSGHTSGTARLWYNGAAIDSGPSRDAGSRFGATVAGSTSDYFLRSPGFTLNTTAGASRVSVDKTVSLSGGNPFVAFGTWSKTF